MFLVYMLPSYIINIDGFEDRWINAVDQFNNLGIAYSRISGVDGNNLCSDVETSNTGKPLLYRWLRDLSASEIGCYLSHRKAWEQIVDSGHPGGFIFEDDFVADRDLVKVMSNISSLAFCRHPVIIKLYIAKDNGPHWYKGWGMMQRQLDVAHRLVLPHRVQYGTVAYYVNVLGARKLIEKSKQINRPIDDVMRRVWQTGVTVLTVIPSVVYHADFDSIISVDRSIEWGAIKNIQLYGNIFGREFKMMNALYTPINMMKARRIFERM